MSRGRKPVDITGKKIGLLTVIKQVEDKEIVSKKTGNVRKETQWLCKCDCGNEIIVSKSNLNSKHTQSCGCLRSYWVQLYNYVKKEIMGYDENQLLSKPMTLSLKGLTSGKHIQNEKGCDERNYSFELVLITFKFCKQDILNGFARHTFNDEMHKFNYAKKIVESKLNDVYVRMKKNKKAEEDIQSMDIPVLNYKSAEYQSSSQNNQNQFVNDEELW